MRNPFRGRSPVEKAQRGGKLTAEEWRSVSFTDGYWPDSAGVTNQYGHASVSRSLSCVPVFGAANLLAGTISSFPPVLYTRDKSGIPIRQPTPSLFNNPSVHGTTVDWIHRAVVSMALQGDAIGLKTQTDFYNFPTMIEWLNPEQVATQDGKMEGPGSYINPMWWWWGRPLDPRSIVHIPWFTMPWRVRGLSPIGAYQMTTNVGLGAQEYALNWYAHGGVPPGTFRNSEKTFSDEDANQITSRLVSRLQSRKPLVYGKDWEYNPIAIKPNEALFVESTRLTATQIAVIYGVPPEKLGGTTGHTLTYTTVEMNTIDYLTFSVRPWLTKLESALSNCFPRGYYVRFDTSDMLRVDAETQAKVDQISLGYQPQAYRNVDEVRADHDWGPMPQPQLPAQTQQSDDQSGDQPGDQPAPAKKKTPVHVPPRPTNGTPSNGQRALLSGKQELARLNDMRQRWTDGMPNGQVLNGRN